jgi:hypothetical protein
MWILITFWAVEGKLLFQRYLMGVEMPLLVQGHWTIKIVGLYERNAGKYVIEIDMCSNTKCHMLLGKYQGKDEKCSKYKTAITLLHWKNHICQCQCYIKCQ